MPKTFRCENCPRVTDLHYVRRADAYLCDDCAECVVEELEIEPVEELA